MFGNTLKWTLTKRISLDMVFSACRLVQFLPSQIVNDHLILPKQRKKWASNPKFPAFFDVFKLSDLWKQQPSSNTI